MNNNSKVLALKYRPQTFDDLIGQEVVAETITNSIKADKIPNAYLFTGIRGIGKTTIARIVAKALNCSNGIEKICRENFCENCKSIINSSHIDVLEMDAAASISRTSIWLELIIDLQFSQKFSLHIFSIPFEQFNAFATILAIVVFPIPLMPVNKYAFGILSALIEFVIVSATTSWPIRSSKVCGLYFNASTFELLFIYQETRT